MSGCRRFFALCCMIYININSKQYLTSTCPNTFLCIWWRILIHLFNRRLTLPLHVLHRHQKRFTIDHTRCNSPLYPGFLTTSEKKAIVSFLASCQMFKLRCRCLYGSDYIHSFIYRKSDYWKCEIPVHDCWYK